MHHEDGEKKVKLLQRSFLSWIEIHPGLENIPPLEFNDFRKEFFKMTFQAYKYGVIGFHNVNHGPLLRQILFEWVYNHKAMGGLPGFVVNNVAAYCFAVTLQSFRIGALVAEEGGIHYAV